MGKILESEFRKELYKNLVDAGYDKKEAQQIVGKKYYVALKDNTIEFLTNAIEKIKTDTFDFSIKEMDVDGNIEDLKNLKGIL